MRDCCVTDIPRDCDSIKSNYSYNGPQLIDIDGWNGDSESNLPPILAYCDMTSYPHVAITQIPHDKSVDVNLYII